MEESIEIKGTWIEYSLRLFLILIYPLLFIFAFAESKTWEECKEMLLCPFISWDVGKTNNGDL